MQENNFLIYFDKEGILGLEYNIYNDLLKKCIDINVVSMQQSLDINHEVIQQIFEHYSFIEYSKNELSKVIEAAKIELKNKSMKNYPEEYYLNSKLKIENCGYVKKCYVNGYVEYCNVHKYEHQEIDHDFLYKTPQDAMQEFNVNIKYNIYQELVTNICIKIKHFIHDILQTCYVKFEVEPSKELTKWLKDHPFSFKTRTKNEKNKIYCYIEPKEKEYFSELVKCQ